MSLQLIISSTRLWVFSMMDKNCLAVHQTCRDRKNLVMCTVSTGWNAALIKLPSLSWSQPSLNQHMCMQWLWTAWCWHWSWQSSREQPNINLSLKRELNSYLFCRQSYQLIPHSNILLVLVGIVSSYSLQCPLKDIGAYYSRRSFKYILEIKWFWR